MKEYWLVIDTLAECLEHGKDTEKLKTATFQLDSELDRRIVDNLPVDEILKLRNVLNRINYGHE